MKVKTNRPVGFENTLTVYCHVYQMSERLHKSSKDLKNIFAEITLVAEVHRYLKNSGPHSQLVAFDMQCLEMIDIKDDRGG